MASKPHNTLDLTGKSPFSRLPMELWLLIVSLVKGKNDQLALCGTSTKFRTLARPLLYKTVELLQWGEQDRKNGLVMTFQSPQIAMLVRDFTIQLNAVASCWDNGDDCPTCSQTDTVIGDALLAMINLRSLHIVCDLCTNRTKERHTYINKLPTEELRSFLFECSNCSKTFVSAQMKRLLSLRSLETVTSFSYLPCGLSNSGRVALDDHNVLPLVQNLQYYATSLDDWILVNRPIKRLISLARGGYEFPATVSQYPGELTHLIVNLAYVGVLRQIPWTFRSLQHVGTFQRNVLDYMREDVNACLPLKTVTSIDVNFLLYPPWNGNDCLGMKVILPLLRKILVHGPTCAVWELHGESWKTRPVDAFTGWDIIRGDCDYLLGTEP